MVSCKNLVGKVSDAWCRRTLPKLWVPDVSSWKHKGIFPMNLFLDSIWCWTRVIDENFLKNLPPHQLLQKIVDPEKKVFDSCCLFTKVSEAFERARFRSRHFCHLIKVNDNFGQEMLQLEMQVCIWTFLDQLASSFVLQLRRAATTLSCIGFSLKLWFCGVLAVWVKAKSWWRKLSNWGKESE